MESVNKISLIAPCGMNCGLCVSYLSMKYELKKEGFRKRYCSGCRPRGKNCTFMKKHCDLLGKGLVRFCYECEKFPCSRLKDLDKRYRTKYHEKDRGTFHLSYFKSSFYNSISLYLIPLERRRGHLLLLTSLLQDD